MISNPSARIVSSSSVDTPTNTKSKIWEDAKALANLLYDIFKEEGAHGNVTGELDSKEAKDA